MLLHQLHRLSTLLSCLSIGPCAVYLYSTAEQTDVYKLPPLNLCFRVCPMKPTQVAHMFTSIVVYPPLQDLLSLNPRVQHHASLVSTTTTKKARAHWRRNKDKSCSVSVYVVGSQGFFHFNCQVHLCKDGLENDLSEVLGLVMCCD